MLLRVCVDTVGVGQVYVGGVNGNVHVAPLSILMMRVLVPIRQSSSKALNCARVEPAGNDAVHGRCLCGYNNDSS